MPKKVSQTRLFLNKGALKLYMKNQNIIFEAHD